MDRDTWEAAFSLFEDIPAMVLDFLSKTSSGWKLEVTEFLRLAFPESVYWGNLQVNKVERGDVEMVEDLIRKVEKDLIVVEADGRIVQRNWSIYEFEVLKCCIKVYGMGNFEMIRKHLPSKNKQQIYNKIQRYIRKQSLEEFHGLKLNLEKVRKQNITNFGDKYRVLSLPLNKDAKLIRRIFMRWRYTRMHEENDRTANRFEGVEAYNFLSIEGLKRVLIKLNELMRGGQVKWNGLPKWSRSIKELREVVITLIDKSLKRGKEIEMYRERARKIVDNEFTGSKLVVAECSFEKAVVANLVKLDVIGRKLRMYFWKKPMGARTCRMKVQDYLATCTERFPVVTMDPPYHPVRGP
eukprot:snap_masked-scaffold_24-processed-gene-0.39-mRNA-1 protein AED:1.00 eAED:1.00 QI:0/0/0/0/1/1/2/0/352